MPILEKKVTQTTPNMKYFNLSVAFQLILGIYFVVLYGLATPMNEDLSDPNRRHGLQVGVEPSGNLTKRQPPNSRAMTDCPPAPLGATIDFVSSICSPGDDPLSYNDPRTYTIYCVVKRNGAADEWVSHEDRCEYWEICHNFGFGIYPMAYCVGDRPPSRTLSDADTLSSISEPVPPEEQTIPLVNPDSVTMSQAMFVPVAKQAHRFSITFVGRNPHDTLYWAESMNLKATKQGKIVGRSKGCEDCARHEVIGWPEDADGYTLNLALKNPHDTFTINVSRVNLPWLPTPQRKGAHNK